MPPAASSARAPAAKKRDHCRKPGNLGQESRANRAHFIAEIKRIWNLNDYMDAIPVSMRPIDGSFGVSALQYMMNIAQRLPDLSDAHRYFTREVATIRSGKIGHLAFKNIITTLKSEGKKGRRDAAVAEDREWDSGDDEEDTGFELVEASEDEEEDLEMEEVKSKSRSKSKGKGKEKAVEKKVGLDKPKSKGKGKGAAIKKTKATKTSSYTMAVDTKGSPSLMVKLMVTSDPTAMDNSSAGSSQEQASVTAVRMGAIGKAIDAPPHTASAVVQPGKPNKGKAVQTAPSPVSAVTQPNSTQAESSKRKNTTAAPLGPLTNAQFGDPDKGKTVNTAPAAARFASQAPHAINESSKRKAVDVAPDTSSQSGKSSKGKAVDVGDSPMAHLQTISKGKDHVVTVPASSSTTSVGTTASAVPTISNATKPVNGVSAFGLPFTIPSSTRTDYHADRSTTKTTWTGVSTTWTGVTPIHYSVMKRTPPFVNEFALDYQPPPTKVRIAEPEPALGQPGPSTPLRTQASGSATVASPPSASTLAPSTPVPRQAKHPQTRRIENARAKSAAARAAMEAAGEPKHGPMGTYLRGIGGQMAEMMPNRAWFNDTFKKQVPEGMGSEIEKLLQETLDGFGEKMNQICEKYEKK